MKKLITDKVEEKVRAEYRAHITAAAARIDKARYKLVDAEIKSNPDLRKFFKKLREIDAERQRLLQETKRCDAKVGQAYLEVEKYNLEIDRYSIYGYMFSANVTSLMDAIRSRMAEKYMYLYNEDEKYQLAVKKMNDLRMMFAVAGSKKNLDEYFATINEMFGTSLSQKDLFDE